MHKQSFLYVSRVSTSLVAGLMVILTTASLAAEVKGDSATITFEGHTLQRIGKGLREFLFIDIYKMGVYTQSGDCDPQRIINTDEAKSIHLSIIREIPADRMSENLRASLERSLPQNASPALRGQIDTFLAQFQGDLKVRTYIDIRYLPGAGTTVYQDGRKLGFTPGLDFSKLLYTAYFGEDTCCSSLKEQILSACAARPVL